MTATIATSTNELNRVNSLLNKNIPSYRQAYSDRTAWIMACLSELAYVRFNPLFANSDRKKWFLDGVAKLVGDNKKSSLLKLIDIVGYDHDNERKRLETELTILKIQLEETFDNGGTQAILAANAKFIALAFRGTEATSMKDIKADAKVKITQYETGGKIHMGFKEAFEKVAIDIQVKINEDGFQKKPLFITGHSLGGALATIAAKKLSHEGGIAACYTFGSPRVGDDEWIANIKAPIYRLVNAADCVTMLPPGDEIITVAAWISRVISKLRVPLLSSAAAPFSRWLLSNLGGYLHGGNMRFLTNCHSGSYNSVNLLYSVSLFYRTKGWLSKKLPWKKFLADHSISIYRRKLMIVAEKRYQIN